MTAGPSIGRDLGTVAGQAAANLASALGTYAVFLVLARRIPTGSLGRYVLVLSIVLVVVQLTDAGDALLSARNALSDGASVALAAGLLRRGRLILAAAAISGSAVWLVADVRAAVAGAVLAGVNSLYYYLLVATQARQRFAWLAGIQVLNGAAFVAAAVLMVTSGSDAATGVWVHVAGTLLPVMLLAVLVRDLFADLAVRPSDPGADPRTRQRYLVAVTASTVSTYADQVGVGVISATVLASYAAGQKPAAALLTLVASMHRVALPKLAGMDEPRRRWSLRMAGRSSVLVPLVPLSAYVLGRPLFEALYPEGLQSVAVFAILAAAYAVDVLAVVPLNLLVLEQRIGSVTRAASFQSVITLAGAVTGGLVGSAVLVAGSVVLGRGVLFAIVHRAARQLPPETVETI